MNRQYENSQRLGVDLVSIGTKTLNFSNQNRTVDNFDIKWPNYHELLTNLPLDWGFFIDVDQLDKTAVLNIGIFVPNELTYRVCPTAALNRDIDPKNLRGTIWYWNLADVRKKEICMTSFPTTVRPNYASRSVVHIGSSVVVYKDYDGALHFMVDDKDLGIAVQKIPRRFYYGWIRIGGNGNVKVTHRVDLSLRSYFRHVIGKAIPTSPSKTSNQKKSTPTAIKEKKEQKGKKEEEKAQPQASQTNDHQASAESASAPTNQRAVNPRPLYVYRMTNKPRGHCLIISNSRFHDQSRNREGADADERALKSLFEEMHFIVTIKKNLKAKEMNDLLYDFARKDHQHFDAFVCVIMTHGGDNNVLLGFDERRTTLEDLMTEVKPTNCRSLQGKPKLFIVQACRGDSREDVASSYCPSSTFASHCSSYRSHIDNMDVDGLASLSSDSTLPRAMCPIEADFLLACATTPGYVALRDPRNGSIFVQVLVDVFRKNRNNYHVLDLLVEVNRRVAERVEELTEGTYWQIPAPTFTLRGVFYFQD